MKRDLEFFLNVNGTPNPSRYKEFKKDLFSHGQTPGITIDTVGTTGFAISAAQTTHGISISGAATYASIYVSATSGRAISVGTKGVSYAASGALTITSIGGTLDAEPARNYLVGVFSKVATSETTTSTDDLGSAWFRTQVQVGITIGASYSLYGVKSQLRIYATAGSATSISNWAAAGLLGVLEVSGATTTFASGSVAAAGYFNVALTTTSVIASGAVVAGVVINTNTAALTDTGAAYFGLYIQNYATAAVVFDAAIRIASGSCTNGIEICTSASPLACTAVGTKAMSVYATCNTTNASTSFEPVLFNTVMTGAGQVGGRVRVNMETDVVLGGWANAFKASADLKSTGGCTGLLSAACFELTAAAKANAATLAVVEIELVTVASATFDARHSLLYSNISGNSTANSSFLTNGHLWRLDGLGSATSAANIFHTTGTVSATHGLRIRIGDTNYDILLKASTYA